MERPTANSANLREAFSFHTSLETVSSSTELESKDLSCQELSFGMSDDESTEDEYVAALPSVFEDETSVSPVASVSTSTSKHLTGLHDTGATYCMFKDKELFNSSTLVTVDDKSKRVKLAGEDMSLAVQSRGIAKMKSGDGRPFTIKDSLYVPSLSHNLIAGGLLKRQGVRERFDSKDGTSFSLVKNNVALFNGYISDDNLMYLQLEPVSSDLESHDVSVSLAESDPLLQHLHLGHVSNRYINLMLKQGCAEGLENVLSDSGGCVVCFKSKGTKLPHNHTRPRAQNFLENVHVDVSGIIRTKSLGNKSYYILLCDDKSGFWHIYGLQSKSKEEVFEVFKSHISMAEPQTGCQLKQFTMDRGGEFVNNLLGAELRDMGIVLHLIAGRTPEKNGVSERGNRTIATRARSMMLQSGVPLSFWYLACCAAVFLTNRCYTKALKDGITPVQSWFFRKPSLGNLRVFG